MLRPRFYFLLSRNDHFTTLAARISCFDLNSDNSLADASGFYFVGTMRLLGRPLCWLPWLGVVLSGGGCFTRSDLPPLNPPAFSGFGPAVPQYALPQPLPTKAYQGVQIINNPVSIPVADRDVAFDQIVDVVDDYFKIESEERVRQTGDIPTEGRIETFPQTAATIFEPQRGDSVTLYDRWESTLQSYRRRALVRVMPEPQGYLVEVQVLKELEFVPRPTNATAGAATLRHDNSGDRRTEAEPIFGRSVGDDPRPVANAVQPLDWIPKGRDLHLEQELLIRITEKLNASTAAIRSGEYQLNPQAPTIFAPPAIESPGFLSPNGNQTVPGLPPPGASIGLPPER